MKKDIIESNHTVAFFFFCMHTHTFAHLRKPEPCTHYLACYLADNNNNSINSLDIFCHLIREHCKHHTQRRAFDGT